MDPIAFTEFNVHEGKTIVLSGLIQRDQSVNYDKVPFLGDIPILGALFRSKSYQNAETELVVFVTPTVIDAHSPGVVDRIQRTEERLQQRLGPMPYLSDPLQPGVNLARLDQPVPPAPAPLPVATVPAAVVPASGEQSMVAEPPPPAVPLAPAQAQATPDPAPGVAEQVPAAAQLSAPAAQSGQDWRVRASVLPLLLAPEPGAPVRRFIRQGQVVQGLARPARGGWTAVQFEGEQGWLASAWLEPAEGAEASDR